ncbi:MAG: thioredoxin domain-containing protein [Hoeflea sp. D1-CHI-28]
MTKRLLVAITAVVALLGFGGATFLYDRNMEVKKDSAASQQEDVLVRAHSPVLGPETAPVTVVEFFDPACEACRAFYPVVKQIMEAFPEKVRVVLRYTTFHKESDEVVRILEAARLQGLFEPVLESVLRAQPSWAAHDAPDMAKAWEAAGAAGLNVQKARSDMLMPDITGVLNQDMADVQTVGVKQTPTFFVNGKPLPSFGAQQLYDLVQSEVGGPVSGENK